MSKPELTLDEKLEQVALKREEYDKIVELLGRKPNDVEIGIIGSMWSEHCGYVSSKIHLKNLPNTGEYVAVGEGENAGVIDVGSGMLCVFKVESHNHPSAVEPYQGAATGVGGIIRDVIAMGARPIASLDSLRFGDPAHPRTKYLFNGVVAGIGGYGNCVGVPTVGGEVYFDPAYQTNPLVNAMTIGVCEKGRMARSIASGVGSLLILVGARTGRDGIFGASGLASEELSEDDADKRPTVQVGDPFLEKLLIEAVMEVAATDAYIGIQDCGAAGLTSSVSEMGAKGGVGVKIDVDKVPAREEGMTPFEFMLSESQERMVICAKPGREAEIEAILRKWGLEFAVIGEVIEQKNFKIYKGDELCADLPIDILGDQAPAYDRPTKKPDGYDAKQRVAPAAVPEPADFGALFKELIGSPNVCSRQKVFRQYDHQVQLNTIMLPGASAAVLRIKGTNRGIAASIDCNGRYCLAEPYTGALIAVSEAARNVVCSGGRPAALTNCLNFANPEKPEVMWQFTETIRAMREASLKLNTPVVSGNVSFYNEADGLKILPTPVIGMVGVVEDTQKIVGAALKGEGNALYLLGEITEDVDSSEYLAKLGIKSEKAPSFDLDREAALQQAVMKLIGEGLAWSCSDVSDGGLLSSAVAMALEGGTGLKLTVTDGERADLVAFSEGQSRVLIEAPEGALAELERVCGEFGVPVKIIGITGGECVSYTFRDREVFDMSVEELSEAYHGGLDF